MNLYLAIATEHTFDNKWDSYDHHAIFDNRDKAVEWAKAEAERLAEKYGAELLDDYPDYPDAYENGFVYWSVETKNLNNQED